MPVGVRWYRFLETPLQPKIALSDGANMIKMRELERLMEQIDTIRAIVGD